MDSEIRKCDVCGELCDEVPTHKHNKTWICRDCGVKYFDRDKHEYSPHSYVKRVLSSHRGRNEYEYISKVEEWG